MFKGKIVAGEWQLNMRGIKEKRKQNRLKERVPVCINREKVFLKIENIFQIRIAYNPLGGL